MSDRHPAEARRKREGAPPRHRAGTRPGAGLYASPFLLLVAALLVAAGCDSGLRRFPLAEPMWRDPDTRAYAPPPAEYYSPFYWDAADQTVFRPMSRALLVDVRGEAVNVNALDEVPNSSWFVNRMGHRPVSVEELVRASCEGPPLDPSKGPWTVTDAKPNGANPGFIIEDSLGRTHLLKFDGVIQPERATAADVMGSIMYWGAGYYAPCNRTVFFEREILALGEDATAEDAGREVPLTWDHIDTALETATQLQDGRTRGTSSLFLPGRPLGPWRYQGTREDDPNDVVPHQDRRELRGAAVLASWINHFDSREQNTLSMWIEKDGDKGYVRHNYIDFGESFGSMWVNTPGISQRFGRARYLDIPYMLEDLVTLGLIEQTWEEAELGPTGHVLGYYDVETFVPAEWRAGYPNPAFKHKTERDAAWMARIIAHFTDEHVHALIDEADVRQPVVEKELRRIILGRRDKILRRWLRKLSPLTQPRVHETTEGVMLCLRDLAIHAKLFEWEHRPYRTRAWVHEGGSSVTPIVPGRMERWPEDRVCVELPQVPDASPTSPGYLIVDVTGMYGRNDDISKPARVHLYHLGGNEYRIAGLERPYEHSIPGHR